MIFLFLIMQISIDINGEHIGTADAVIYDYNNKTLVLEVTPDLIFLGGFESD